MAEIFANSGDPDQTPQYAATDLGLHCLQERIFQLFGGNQTKT